MSRYYLLQCHVVLWTTCKRLNAQYLGCRISCLAYDVNKTASRLSGLFMKSTIDFNVQTGPHRVIELKMILT